MRHLISTSPEAVNRHCPSPNLHRLSFRCRGASGFELAAHHGRQDRWIGWDRFGSGDQSGQCPPSSPSVENPAATALPPQEPASPHRWQGCTETVRLGLPCGCAEIPFTASHRITAHLRDRIGNRRFNRSIGSLIQVGPGHQRGAPSSSAGPHTSLAAGRPWRPGNTTGITLRDTYPQPAETRLLFWP